MNGVGSVDAYYTILDHVPIAPTAAKFTETMETTKLEADGALPIYPLAFIKVSAPKDIFITGDEISYDKYNYDMIYHRSDIKNGADAFNVSAPFYINN